MDVDGAAAPPKASNTDAAAAGGSGVGARGPKQGAAGGAGPEGEPPPPGAAALLSTTWLTGAAGRLASHAGVQPGVRCPGRCAVDVKKLLVAVVAGRARCSARTPRRTHLRRYPRRPGPRAGVHSGRALLPETLDSADEVASALSPAAGAAPRGAAAAAAAAGRPAGGHLARRAEVSCPAPQAHEDKRFWHAPLHAFLSWQRDGQACVPRRLMRVCAVLLPAAGGGAGARVLRHGQPRHAGVRPSPQRACRRPQPGAHTGRPGAEASWSVSSPKDHHPC